MTATRIVYFTDTHLGQRLVTGDEAGDTIRYEDAPDEHWDRLRLVLDDISSKGIAHVVFGGDIGTQDSAGSFFELLEEYDFDPSIVLGNHDAYGIVMRYRAAEAGPVEGKMCSSHGDGLLKQIFLDSSDNTIGAAQMTWLAGELDKVCNAIIFVHHPILAIDTPVERSGVALRDGDKIKALLTSFDGEATIVCGHYHMDVESRDARIRQLVTPAVSYQIAARSDRIQTDTRTFGYRILDIDGAKIETEVVLLTKT